MTEREEKFTPGPYGFYISMMPGRRQFLVREGDPYHIIAELTPVDETDDEAQANGDLLKASVDLYYALKPLLSDEHARDLSVFYSEERDENMKWTPQEKEEAEARIAEREKAGYRALDRATGYYEEECNI